MNATNRIARFFALCALSVVFGVVELCAFTMEPIVAVLEPSGAKSIATFRFRNDAKAPIALRLKVLTRSAAPDGSEINQPSLGEFEIYPARLVVEPAALALVKVRWLGDASPKRELSYRLVAEQVPVDFNTEPEKGLKVLFRYVASLYVGQAGFKPEIVARAIPEVASDGSHGFRIELANQGSRHVVVQELNLSILSNQIEIAAFASAGLGRLNDANYLPGTKRSLFIPNIQALDRRTYEVQVHFEAYD